MFGKSVKSEREDMRAASDLIEMVEALSDRRALFRFLAICAIGNLLIWIVSVVFASRVYDAMSYVVPDKIGVIVLGIPFGLGMYLTYCIFRLKVPTIEDNKHLHSEMMASFAYQSESTKRWFVWLFSVLGGLVNVLLLIIANMYFADQL
jgi:hypothetical protein